MDVNLRHPKNSISCYNQGKLKLRCFYLLDQEHGNKEHSQTTSNVLANTLLSQTCMLVPNLVLQRRQVIVHSIIRQTHQMVQLVLWSHLSFQIASHNFGNPSSFAYKERHHHQIYTTRMCLHRQHQNRPRP